MSRSAVRDAIKSVFGNAATWLRSRGLRFTDRADELVRASAHRLRHIRLAPGRRRHDLRTVGDNLGHVSLTTTSLYLHAEEDKRHRETVKDLPRSNHRG